MENRPRHRPKVASFDDRIIETWIKHRGITGYLEREARATWEMFKSLTNNKPLKDCTRDDGRMDGSKNPVLD